MVEIESAFGFPERAGHFRLRLDLVADGIAWFSQRGSPTTDIEMSVVWSESRDPHRFDELFGALAPSTRTLLDELSPVTRIPHVVAPVELASAPDDRYCPVDESRALARAGREVRLTVTPALDHVRPRIRPGLARVVALLDRTLRRAAKAGPSPVLQPSPGL